MTPSFVFLLRPVLANVTDVLLPHGSNDNEPLAYRPHEKEAPPPRPNDDGPGLPWPKQRVAGSPATPATTDWALHDHRDDGSDPPRRKDDERGDGLGPHGPSDD